MSEDQRRIPNGYDEVEKLLLLFTDEQPLINCIKQFKDISHNLPRYVFDQEEGLVKSMLRGLNCGFYIEDPKANMFYISTSRMEQFFGRSKSYITRDLRESRFRRMEGQKLSEEFIKLLHTAGINERQWTVWYRKHI